ncbi:hypothetical protein OAO01_04295 [Oligoflexia bacterium]|nr:hypothetical protein [Oligoflexia bacterium]
MFIEKVLEYRACPNCSERFAVSDRDAAHYEKIDVPWPSWCPLCRHLRRHGAINDYVFYTRACDGCSSSFVSAFPPESEYQVFCQTCWYDDQRDDSSQGRDYDPERSFFDQFDELMHAMPQLGMIGMNNENCEYCESTANCKNCYLISECSNCEDSLYAYWIQKTLCSLNLCYAHECERCYEVVDCFGCYNLQHSQNCSNCSDSLFLFDCIGCTNCLFSSNLRHKEYYIFNKPFSKSDYLAEINNYRFGRYSQLLKYQEQFNSFLLKQPHRNLRMENVEDSSGDYLRDAKNCKHIFHGYNIEDCAFGEHVWRGAKDCYDINTAGRNAELIYESTNCGIDVYNVKFSRYCWESRDIEYCNQCPVSRNLFGCAALTPGAQYRVLNKQYSKEDYEALVKKIKVKMRSDGEYGEFFPLSISLFGYNNSVSYDDRAYSKEDVLARGWKWEVCESATTGKGTVADIADDIQDVDAAICKEILTCQQCTRNYKIINPEFVFHQKENIPLPRTCPDCRHRARLAKRNPKELYQSICANCEGDMLTTYAPGGAERVYCRECYLELVY